MESLIKEIMDRANTWRNRMLIKQGKIVEAVTSIKQTLRHYPQVKLPSDFWTIDFSERIAARLKRNACRITIEQVVREIVREILF